MKLQQVQRKNLRLKQRLLKPLHLRKEEVVPNSGNSSPIFPEPPTNFRAGMEFWSASGASSASSSFAPWIINHIEAETDLAVVPGLAYRPTVGLSF